MKYDIDYFIKFYSKIPRNRWCVGEFEIGDLKCALGHCGLRKGDFCNFLSIHLDRVFVGTNIVDINDGTKGWAKRLKSNHPKTRILRALRLAKRGKL